jgi:hypothetical protein
MEEREEGECSESSGECYEDMSPGWTITRRDLGSPVVSESQLIHSQVLLSLPNGLMAVEVVCETPSKITKLSSATSSSARKWEGLTRTSLALVSR